MTEERFVRRAAMLEEHIDDLVTSPMSFEWIEREGFRQLLIEAGAKIPARGARPALYLPVTTRKMLIEWMTEHSKQSYARRSAARVRQNEKMGKSPKAKLTAKQAA